MAQVDPFMAASASWQATRRGAVRDRPAPIVPSRRPVDLLPDPRQAPTPRRRRIAFATVVRIAGRSTVVVAIRDALIIGLCLAAVWAPALGGL